MRRCGRSDGVENGVRLDSGWGNGGGVVDVGLMTCDGAQWIRGWLIQNVIIIVGGSIKGGRDTISALM